MKKLLVALATATILASPVLVLAISETTPPSSGSLPQFTNVSDKVKTAIWMVFVLIAVVMFVIAGFMFLTAQGAPEKLQLARATALWGIIGIVVAIIAYSIIYIVGNWMGV